MNNDLTVICSPDDLDLQRSKYEATLAEVTERIPFDYAYAKTNPFSGEEITTVEAYEEYLRLLALRLTYNDLLADTQSIAVAQTKELSARCSTAERELSAVSSALHDSEEKVKRSRKIIDIFLVIIVVFSGLLVWSLFSYADRRYDAGYSYADSVLRSEFQLKSQQQYDKGYDAGYAVGYSKSLPSSAASIPFTSAPSASNSSAVRTFGGSSSPRDTSPSPGAAYIGNTSSKKFHRPTCSYLPDQANRTSFSSREAALSAGYSPCNHCNP